MLACAGLSTAEAWSDPSTQSADGGLPGQASPKTAGPPVAQRKPHGEELFGEARSDDYFWLRDKQSSEVRAYLEAENAYTAAMMAGSSQFQEALYRELVSHLKETDLSVPYRKGDFLYYYRTEQGKQYRIYCRKQGTLSAPEEVLLDLNEIAKTEKFVGVGGLEVSDDGWQLAYRLDTTGFRQYTLHVKDLRSGKLGPERIPRVDSVAWARDNRTLFYVVEDDTKRPYRAYRHTLGSTEADVPIFEEKDERFTLTVARSRSLDYLFLESSSHTTSEWRYLRATTPTGSFRLIAARQQDHEYSVDHRGERFYILTNRTGRNFALASAPVSKPGPEQWKTLIAHSDAVMLTGLDVFQDFYVLKQREGGVPQLRVTDFRTGSSTRVPLPEPDYALFPEANEEFQTTSFRFGYTSLVTPRSVFDYDVHAQQRRLLKQDEVPGYDASLYQAERLEAVAPDGTKVPLSIVFRKGLRRDGQAPLLLTGYGSYGAPFWPAFEPGRLVFLDRGVAVAIAHIRGGGEMGKRWHDDGRMLKKRNTFTDFIASAEFLIAEKWTTAGRLVIRGGSAGGLLMGAVTNLRPDLFKAVVALVPFVDVVNTMLDPTLPLTVGEFEEWGNPRKETEYRYILSYSPYDNLAAKAYPAMLVLTSFNDSQVMYWEPAKYVARMRRLKTDANPLLLKVNLDPAGHGGKSGRYEQLRERAFEDAWMLQQLGVAPVESTVPGSTN